MKKIICILTALLFIVPMLVLSASAEDPLTVKKAVLIDDNKIIIYFSEKISVNKRSSNNGPYIALRVVDGEDNLIYDGKTPLQQSVSALFYDDAQDSLLLIYTGTNYTLAELLSFEGKFAPYKDMGYSVKLCIEEIPFNDGGNGDLYIDNITTFDVKTKLTATKKGGYDGVYLNVETDYSIKVDMSLMHDIRPKEKRNLGTVLKIKDVKPSDITTEAKGTEPEDDETEENKSEKKAFEITGPMIILGAVVIVAIIAIVMAIVLTGGKKEVKAEEKKDD